MEAILKFLGPTSCGFHTCAWFRNMLGRSPSLRSLFFGPGQLCRGTLHSCSFERPVAVGKNANKLCRGDSELLTKHFLDQDQNRKGMGDNIEGGLQIEKVVVPFTT